MRAGLLLLAAALGGGALAQGSQLSLGVDMAFPIGNFAEWSSFGYGPALGFEYPVGDKVGLAVQTSYMMLSIKDDDVNHVESSYLIPIQAAFKFYMEEQQRGGYFSANIGVHSNGLTTTGHTIPATIFGPEQVVEGSTETSTDFSWGLGFGYQLNKLDLGTRFNHVSPQVEGAEAMTYIGLRIGYLFNLGGN